MTNPTNRTDLAALWKQAEAFECGYITPCLMLPRKPQENGYVRIQIDGKSVGAHRAMYERLVGPIPNGMHIDHLCRNRGCVNPAHLEPVTPKENVLRGIGVTALCAKKQHCSKGHEFNQENTLHVSGRRKCRKCNASANRARRAAGTPANKLAQDRASYARRKDSINAKRRARLAAGEIDRSGRRLDAARSKWRLE